MSRIKSFTSAEKASETADLVIEVCTLHPTPYNPHPAPCTLNRTPYTLHPSPYTLQTNTPYSLLPTPNTLHPTP